MPNLTKEKTFAGLKIIWKYLKPHKRMIFILSIFSIFSAGANAAVPYLAGRIIDGILAPQQSIEIFFYSIPTAIFFVAVWFLIMIIANISDWQLTSKKERLSMTAFGEYVVRGFSHLMELPLSFHKKHKMGEISDRIQRAASWLDSIISNVAVNLVAQLLGILIAFIIIFSIKPFLASVLFGAALIYVLILSRITPELTILKRKEHRAWNRAYGDAFDAVLNTQSVKQATAEKHEEKKLFKNFFLKGIKFWLDFWKIWQRISLSQRLIVSLTQLAIFLISIFLIWKGEMTIGQLAMFNGYAAMIFGPFTILANNWHVIQNGFVSLERAEKILDHPKEIYEPENTVILSKIKGGVKFSKVSFSYENKKQKVLNNINFAVEPGETVALVGESGVGKSTLIDLISFYFKPIKGDIFIDGHNLQNLNLKFLRSQIAVVPQEIILFNDTIKNNIRYGSFSASERRVVEAAQKAHCAEFIEKFPKKYEQMVGERGIKLSVGQKQRIAIARAILRDPKILILDEPTSALDAKSEKFVTEALEELMKGRTTFIIAHRLSTVRKANRILVLENGRIVEEGNHNDLIKIENGAYRKFYELQRL
ncbi:MAG: ABC transporter ATP-binding protein [Patescibacteria group bacterium]